MPVNPDDIRGDRLNAAFPDFDELKSELDAADFNALVRWAREVEARLVAAGIPPDTVAPTAPTLSAPTADATSVTITYAPGTDAVGISRRTIRWGEATGVYVNSRDMTPPELSAGAFTLAQLETDKTFYVIVEVDDVAGNGPVASNEVNATTSAWTTVVEDNFNRSSGTGLSGVTPNVVNNGNNWTVKGGSYTTTTDGQRAEALGGYRGLVVPVATGNWAVELNVTLGADDATTTNRRGGVAFRCQDGTDTFYVVLERRMDGNASFQRVRLQKRVASTITDLSTVSPAGGVAASATHTLRVEMDGSNNVTVKYTPSGGSEQTVINAFSLSGHTNFSSEDDLGIFVQDQAGGLSFDHIKIQTLAGGGGGAPLEQTLLANEAVVRARTTGVIASHPQEANIQTDISSGASILAAINANPGSTVFGLAAGGSYAGQKVQVPRAVTIVGRCTNPASPAVIDDGAIQAAGAGYVVSVYNVRLQNLSTNGGATEAAIWGSDASGAIYQNVEVVDANETSVKMGPSAQLLDSVLDGGWKYNWKPVAGATNVRVRRTHMLNGNRSLQDRNNDAGEFKVVNGAGGAEVDGCLIQDTHGNLVWFDGVLDGNCSVHDCVIEGTVPIGSASNDTHKGIFLELGMNTSGARYQAYNNIIRNLKTTGVDVSDGNADVYDNLVADCNNAFKFQLKHRPQQFYGADPSHIEFRGNIVYQRKTPSGNNGRILWVFQDDNPVTGGFTGLLVQGNTFHLPAGTSALKWFKFKLKNTAAVEYTPAEFDATAYAGTGNTYVYDL